MVKCMICISLYNFIGRCQLGKWTLHGNIAPMRVKEIRKGQSVTTAQSWYILGINRFKQHLARVGTDVTGCPNVPAQVSHETLQRLVQKFGQMAGQVSFGRAQSRDHQPNASGHPVSTFPHLKVA